MRQYAHSKNFQANFVCIDLHFMQLPRIILAYTPMRLIRKTQNQSLYNNALITLASFDTLFQPSPALARIYSNRPNTIQGNVLLTSELIMKVQGIPANLK